MKIIDSPIPLGELSAMAEAGFGDLVKAVVDVERGIMVVDADLHSDEEALLLELGSEQRNLWGINIYPDLVGIERVEFDAMINVRPSQGNHSRSIDDAEIRTQVFCIVQALLLP